MESDKAVNDLGAKLIQTELKGNTERNANLISILQSKSKSYFEKATNLINRKSECEEVIFLSTRVRQSREEHDSNRKSKKPKLNEGVRKRHRTGEDRSPSKEVFSSESEDDGINDRLTRKEGGEGAKHGKSEMVERPRATSGYRQNAAEVRRCSHCFDGQEYQEHLTIATGKRVSLRLPEIPSLTHSHCLIVPAQHSPGRTYLNKDVINEIKIFKEVLASMFEDQKLDVVFFESCINREQHVVVHCVPLPTQVYDLALKFFKKAVANYEADRTKTKGFVKFNKKGIHKLISRGVSYFAVEFGLEEGYVYEIDNEETFSNAFGEEIIGGMLDLDPWRPLHYKPQFAEQRNRVLKFNRLWQPYDWAIRQKSPANGRKSR